MPKKPYETPKVFELGTVQELTRENSGEDKCAGSGDSAFPVILSPNFATDCPMP